MMEALFGGRVPGPPPASSAVERFSCEIHGSANGVILIANERRYVVQLDGDSEDAFQAVLDAVENAYSVHRKRFLDAGGAR